jgi:uncharacterized membrane protein YccC
VLVSVLVAVLGFQAMAQEDWIALAGSTLWVKLFMSFALSRHAHGGFGALGRKGRKGAKH